MMISSSDVVWNIDGTPTQVAREMTKAEIKEVIEHYCKAAMLCKTAGFDMVMIHGAHGQLPAQFLSPFFNHRTDEYGGSAENRMRFPLELLAALRKTLGPDFAIEYRISGDEVDEQGMRIERHGCVSWSVHRSTSIWCDISAGIDPSNHERRFNPSYMEPHNVNAECAALAKKRLHIPVAVVGGISYHEDAERMIADGMTDMVSIGCATYPCILKAIRRLNWVWKRRSVPVCAAATAAVPPARWAQRPPCARLIPLRAESCNT